MIYSQDRFPSVIYNDAPAKVKCRTIQEHPRLLTLRTTSKVERSPPIGATCHLQALQPTDIRVRIAVHHFKPRYLEAHNAVKDTGMAGRVVTLKQCQARLTRNRPGGTGNCKNSKNTGDWTAVDFELSWLKEVTLEEQSHVGRCLFPKTIRRLADVVDDMAGRQSFTACEPVPDRLYAGSKTYGEGTLRLDAQEFDGASTACPVCCLLQRWEAEKAGARKMEAEEAQAQNVEREKGAG